MQFDCIPNLTSVFKKWPLLNIPKPRLKNLSPRYCISIIVTLISNGYVVGNGHRGELMLKREELQSCLREILRQMSNLE